jgi:hypothetical protein
MASRIEMGDQQNDGALVSIEHEVFMPALSVQQAVGRFNSVVEFVRTVMREGTDYGVIPGTDKATLLKPGAEKLCTLFGLTSRFEIIRAVEDWTGEEHGGEPFFYYLYRCHLRRGEVVIAEGDGSCNSWEQKYRYRDAKRKCPACGQAAIIQGREEYGGGWICFRKRGGCGAKYLIDDPVIADQQAGRVVNENIADQVNTIQKMAQKRAMIQAVLLAVNGSEFFTQDSEDFFGDPELAAAKQVSSPQKGEAAKRASEVDARADEADFVERIKQEQWLCTPAQKHMIIALVTRILAEGGAGADVRQLLLSRYSVESPALLTPSVAPSYINDLKQMLRPPGR